MASYARLAKKLQSAINERTGDQTKLLINTQQWYSEDKRRPVTCYVIKHSSTVGDKGQRTTVELFRTYSQVQMVLWLRDYWYELNGWDVPTDNEEWEVLKQRYADTREANDITPETTPSAGQRVGTWYSD